jgi:hypothetical protein
MRIEFATCPNCGRTLYEGRRAIYDDYADAYFCDRNCQREWYDANLDRICAQRGREVDL